MSGTILSLIPPLLVLVCVLLTRRVILSITVGILSSALILHDLNFGTAFSSIVDTAVGLVYSDGEWSLGNIYLISFLLILGMITAFISATGGTAAFAQWAQKRVTSREGSQFLAFVLGIVIFIDDYFNALTVGQISRPLTDRYGVSRTKLAYLIDSTSAPVCVVSPISSWGAYIIFLLGTIFATYNVTDMSALSGFMQIIPLNFYAVLSILMVVAVIKFNINIGPMKRFEHNVEEMVAEKIEVGKGKAADLLLPIGTLIVVVVGMIFLTGYLEAGEFNIFAMVENANTNLSLFVGSLAGLVVAIVRFFLQGQRDVFTHLFAGAKSMMGAVVILLFAWTLTDLISGIGTGEYLSQLLNAWNVKAAFLPVLLFVVAAVMAFATGTSWGTFGLMLPIGAQMAMTLEPELLLVALAAVLAGAVFGDHCSPISDTTILSSTGAQCSHVDHVATQLPYAMIVAGISAIGFLVVGLTGNYLLSVGITLVLFGVVVYILKRVSETQTTEEQLVA